MDIDARLLIRLAVALSLGLLFAAAARGRPKVVSADGSLEFRHSLAFRAFGWAFAFAMPIAISIFGTFVPTRNREDLWAMLGIYAFFAAIGLPLWWEGSRYSLVVSDRGLDARSPWRGRMSFAWDEIEAISFNSSAQWFVIKAKDGRTFRVPVLVAGVREFLARCEARLPGSALAKAKLGYAQVGRAFPRG